MGSVAVGWGDALQTFFDPRALIVRNCSRGGTSTRMLYASGTWDREVRSKLHAGDFVLIQFSHHESALLEGVGTVGSKPGIGDEVIHIVQDGTQVEVHSFGWYLTRFINETRAAGAQPIVISSTPKNVWSAGRFIPLDNEYDAWAAAVAKRERVAFLDLNQEVCEEYDLRGPKFVKALFPIDKNHTSLAGAQLNAALLTRLLLALPSSIFTERLSDSGKKQINDLRYTPPPPAI